MRTEAEQILLGFEAGADDYLLLDFSGRRISLCHEGDWQEVHLPPLQFELLETLTPNVGRIVPATTLKDRVWGKPVSDAALAVYVHRRRRKLEPDPVRASLTELAHGCGGARQQGADGPPLA